MSDSDATTDITDRVQRAVAGGRPVEGGDVGLDLEQLLVSIEAREQVMAASLRLRVMHMFDCATEDEALAVLRRKARSDEGTGFYQLLLEIGWGTETGS